MCSLWDLRHQDHHAIGNDTEKLAFWDNVFQGSATLKQKPPLFPLSMVLEGWVRDNLVSGLEPLLPLSVVLEWVGQR